MSTQWILNTHGDPLGTLNQFIRTIWEKTRLDGLVVAAGDQKEAYLLEDPGQVGAINPFRPVMTANLARLLPETLKVKPDARLGVLLRPCEMRALIEVSERGALQIDRLLTICVDCLGTFPEDEFEWRSARKGAEGGLASEALQFAPQGGISVYRYRAACQMCVSPGATGADINIGVLGLPVREKILVSVKNGKLNWKEITDGLADSGLVDRHDAMLARLSERHIRTRERVISGLAEVLPPDVNALIDQFAACGNCQSCMGVCPICAADAPRMGKNGRLERESVVNWLVSCAGCGMCEQNCPNHLPLSIIFTHIKEQIEKELAM
jgi:formate dehydrogenase subunit beta